MKPPHRDARLHYGPRVASFALSFVASAILMAEGLAPWSMLPAAALLFLLYPHLAYLHSRVSGNGREVARRYLILDALLLGAWLPVISFNLGFGFAMFAAVMLNNSITGGWRRLLRAIAAFAVGAVVVGWLTGFRFEPAGSLRATALGLIGILLYMNIVTEVFHRQNLRMLAVMRDNAAKRKLFEELAGAGLAAARADSVHAIVDILLDRLVRVLPPGRGVGMIVRDRSRVRLVYCAAFRGVSAQRQVELRAEADGLRRDDDIDRASAHDDHRWRFVGAASTQFESLFVICSKALGPLEQGAVSIFLQQYAVMLENHALTTRLRELASTDGLTGLANRARFDECLANAIARKQRSPDSDFCLIAVDINGLKGVNDNEGHEAGDRLIIAAARLLQSASRETDVVARVGGDEFVVLCPATRNADAAHLVSRLRARLADQRTPPTVSVSLGLADSSECAVADVMNLADQRMYADKAAFYRDQHARN